MALAFKKQVTAFVGMKAWSAKIKSVSFNVSTTSLEAYAASYKIEGQPAVLCGVYPTQGEAIDRLTAEATAMGLLEKPTMETKSKGVRYRYWKIPTGRYAGQWRWHLRAANHQIIASGEAYHNKQDCLHAIALVMGSFDAPVEEDKDRHKGAKKTAK